MKLLKFAIAALAALSLAASPAISQTAKTKTQLTTEIGQNFPDNTTGFVTPADVRGTFSDFVSSWQQAPSVNRQAGTSYTFQASDYGQLVTFNNSGAIAATLPQAIGSFNPWNAFVQNVGTGMVTITPQGGSLINGASLLQVAAGGSAFIVSDGTNYQVSTNSNFEGSTIVGDANYSALSTDHFVASTATFTAPRTWTLPAASSVNPFHRIVIFASGLSATNTLTVVSSGTDLLNAGTGTASSAVSNKTFYWAEYIAITIAGQGYWTRNIDSDIGNGHSSFVAAGTVKCRPVGAGSGVPQDCGQPVINVTDAPYNADPTGVADSTIAIQNAINALPATGGTVLFPVGNYLISSTLTIGNGSGSTYSTRNGVNLECVARTRPGLNGLTGSPSVGPCNINSNVNDYAIKVNGPISGWGVKGISITITSSGSSAGCLNTNSVSFGDTQDFSCNNVQNIGVLEFVNSGGTASFFNTWRNVQIRLGTPAAAQGLHIGSNQASTDNFGDSWDNLNIIPQTASQQCLYIGSADSMVFNRMTINPGSCSAILSYNETANWPSGIAFINPDFGTGNTLSNNSSPNASAAPNYILGLNTVNNGTVPNLANLAVLAPNRLVLSPRAGATPNGQLAIDTAGHLGYSGSTPTLTAGCNGAGSSVNGNDNAGQVTGQTAAATTCTLTFAKAYASQPSCVASGTSGALTGQVIATTTTLQVSFASTGGFVWNYHCDSIN